jgi:hypothetical protein
MKKSEWSDNELEDLLRKMPKIQDHRNPRDIYQSLSIEVKQRKRPVWIIPSAASVAAVLLLSLLMPNVWQGIFHNSSTKQDSEMTTYDENSSMELTKIMPKDDINANDTKMDSNNNQGINALMAISPETAVYEEDVVNQDIITYMVPDGNAQILVPITVIVPKENKSWLELFLINSEKLTEQQWGLSDYYPLNATLSMIDDQTMNVDVPEGHLYGTGSTNETSFISIMEETMNKHSNLNRISFSTNGKQGILLGNYGEITEIKRTEQKMRSYFLYYPNNQNLPFIVPGKELYTDIRAALSSMLVENQNYGLMPSIPDDFVFQLEASSKEKLVLTFDSNFHLTDEPKSSYAIEAILLTAKEFGYQSVKFENSSISQVGRFNLEHELKVPIAPNKVTLQ